MIKDFNFKSLRETIEPILFNLNKGASTLNVRVNTTDIAALLSKIKSKWVSVSPNRQFSYTFLDDDYDAVYRAEKRTAVISTAFTTLAIIIACLGLFGLAAYAAEQRTKEIGIRKVLGANVSIIISMLSMDFIRLIIISIIIAIPGAWWAMSGWLQGFAYRQNIQWWVPLVSGVLAVTIALITITFQSIKAALANPIKSLRSE